MAYWNWRTSRFQFFFFFFLFVTNNFFSFSFLFFSFLSFLFFLSLPLSSSHFFQLPIYLLFIFFFFKKKIGNEVSKVFVGNKFDLIAKAGRGIQESEAKALAESLSVPYFECSARENKNVAEAFETLASTAIKYAKGDDKKDVIKPSEKKEKSHEKCNC